MDASYRERTEELELEVLSPRARPVSRTRGRAVAEPEDDIRTAYQRDRDRIVHSKAFRRLAHKTQVFLAPEGDHYRVRLTHTLEVTQVARTIARALRLNEDLVEAICLGHDLGHTPFGHQGEQVVARFWPGFRHNLQSVRIVEVLECLNLTWEVRDGIANHTWSMPMPESLEGQIARYADRIAYINHDIDDAIRAGILAEGELPDEALHVLGDSHSRRIHTMVADLVDASDQGDSISMSPEVFAAMGVTREFLFKRVYLGRGGPPTPEDVELIVQGLLEHFERNGAGDEGFAYSQIGKPDDIDARARAVDYVAGMTDRFALRAYESLVGELPAGVGALG